MNRTVPLLLAAVPVLIAAALHQPQASAMNDDPAADAVGQLQACYVRAIESVDDGASDPQLVALKAMQACSAETDAAVAVSRDLPPDSPEMPDAKARYEELMLESVADQVRVARAARKLPARP